MNNKYKKTFTAVLTVAMMSQNNIVAFADETEPQEDTNNTQVQQETNDSNAVQETSTDPVIDEQQTNEETKENQTQDQVAVQSNEDNGVAVQDATTETQRVYLYAQVDSIQAMKDKGYYVNENGWISLGYIDVPGLSAASKDNWEKGHSITSDDFKLVMNALQTEKVTPYTPDSGKLVPLSDVDFKYNGDGKLAYGLITSRGAEDFHITYGTPVWHLDGYINAEAFLNRILVTDSPSNSVYDGKSHEWKPTVKNEEGKILTEGTDYTVSYDKTDFTNVGTITVTITGIGKYTGTVSKKYEITQRPITIKAQDKETEYTGNEIGPDKGAYELSNGTLADGDSLESVSLSGGAVEVGKHEKVLAVSNGKISKNKEGVKEDVTKNYAISYEPGTLTITRKSWADVGVNVTNGEKTYDGTPVKGQLELDHVPA